MGTRTWEPHHLRFAVEAAGVAMWCWDVQSDQLTMDELGFQLWGLPWADAVSFEQLSTHIHPADRDRVRAAFQATEAVSGQYETDFRISIGDEVRWVSARGKGDTDHQHGNAKYGVFLDVTRRKQIEESNEILAGEMSHRVLNLLTIATALTNMTGKSAASVADMTRQLVHRLTALGRVHSLVRPVPGHEGQAALLGDLIAVILAPYDDEDAFAGRIRISVPRMGIGENTATTLAMVVHELATNSLKHGALSVPAGMLEISSTSSESEIEIIWAETGGPPVTTPPNHHGYGGRLLRRAVETQLQGELTMDWQPTGLVATLRIARDRLVS